MIKHLSKHRIKEESAYGVRNEEKWRTLAPAELNDSTETDYRRHRESLSVCLLVVRKVSDRQMRVTAPLCITGKQNSVEAGRLLKCFGYGYQNSIRSQSTAERSVIIHLRQDGFCGDFDVFWVPRDKVLK